MTDVFTEDIRTTIDERNITVIVSWRENVTLRRLRLGWTKDRLASECGVSRTQLWRMLECPPSNDKYLPLTAEVIDRVNEALARFEAEDAVA